MSLNTSVATAFSSETKAETTLLNLLVGKLNAVGWMGTELRQAEVKRGVFDNAESIISVVLVLLRLLGKQLKGRVLQWKPVNIVAYRYGAASSRESPSPCLLLFFFLCYRFLITFFNQAKGGVLLC